MGKYEEVRPMTKKEVKDSTKQSISIKDALIKEDNLIVGAKIRPKIGNTKTYSDKLKHPKWQRKRLEILNRDNFKCTLCNDKETELHVHHEKYEKGEPWDINNKYLTTLCKHCHFIIEYFKLEEPELKIYKIFKTNNTLEYVTFISSDSMGLTFGCLLKNKITIFFGVSLNGFKQVIEFYNTCK